MTELVFPRGVRTSRPFTTLPAALAWIDIARGEDRPCGPISQSFDGQSLPIARGSDSDWSTAPFLTDQYPAGVRYVETLEALTELDKQEQMLKTGHYAPENADLGGFEAVIIADTAIVVVVRYAGTLYEPLIKLDQLRAIAGYEDASRRLGLPIAKDRRNYGATKLKDVEDATAICEKAALTAINQLITEAWIIASRHSSESGVSVILEGESRPRSSNPAGTPRLGFSRKVNNQ